MRKYLPGHKGHPLNTIDGVFLGSPPTTKVAINPNKFKELVLKLVKIPSGEVILTYFHQGATKDNISSLSLYIFTCPHF